MAKDLFVSTRAPTPPWKMQVPIFDPPPYPDAMLRRTVQVSSTPSTLLWGREGGGTSIFHRGESRNGIVTKRMPNLKLPAKVPAIGVIWTKSARVSNACTCGGHLRPTMLTRATPRRRAPAAPQELQRNVRAHIGLRRERRFTYAKATPLEK